MVLLRRRMLLRLTLVLLPMCLMILVRILSLVKRLRRLADLAVVNLLCRDCPLALKILKVDVLRLVDRMLLARWRISVRRLRRLRCICRLCIRLFPRMRNLVLKRVVRVRLNVVRLLRNSRSLRGPLTRLRSICSRRLVVSNSVRFRFVCRLLSCVRLRLMSSPLFLMLRRARSRVIRPVVLSLLLVLLLRLRFMTRRRCRLRLIVLVRRIRVRLSRLLFCRIRISVSLLSMRLCLLALLIARLVYLTVMRLRLLVSVRCRLLVLLRVTLRLRLRVWRIRRRFRSVEVSCMLVNVSVRRLPILPVSRPARIWLLFLVNISVGIRANSLRLLRSRLLVSRWLARWRVTMRPLFCAWLLCLFVERCRDDCVASPRPPRSHDC